MLFSNLIILQKRMSNPTHLSRTTAASSAQVIRDNVENRKQSFNIVLQTIRTPKRPAIAGQASGCARDRCCGCIRYPWPNNNFQQRTTLSGHGTVCPLTTCLILLTFCLLLGSGKTVKLIHLHSIGGNILDQVFISLFGLASGSFNPALNLGWLCLFNSSQSFSPSTTCCTARCTFPSGVFRL